MIGFSDDVWGRLKPYPCPIHALYLRLFRALYASCQTNTARRFLSIFQSILRPYSGNRQECLKQ